MWEGQFECWKRVYWECHQHNKQERHLDTSMHIICSNDMDTTTKTSCASAHVSIVQKDDGNAGPCTCCSSERIWKTGIKEATRHHWTLSILAVQWPPLAKKLPDSLWVVFLLYSTNSDLAMNGRAVLCAIRKNHDYATSSRRLADVQHMSSRCLADI